MTDFPYSLIATDLDGTILRSDHSISDRTRRIVGKIVETGVTIVLVTARPPRVIQKLAAALGFNGLAICCNGAIIYDLATDTIIHHNPIPYETIMQVAATLKNALPGSTFAWERGLVFGWEPRFASLHTFSIDEIIIPEDFLSLDQSPFSKLIVLDPDHSPDTLLEFARSHAGPDVTITHSGAPFIEISAKGVTKASALLTLANELSIPHSRIIAFGDMPNDLPMLELAGHSVAVANAHPAVLERADEITLSNNEDGVAAVLERLFYNSGPD